MKSMIRTMAGVLLLLHAGAMYAQAQTRERPERAARSSHDNFYWLGEINKTSTVMVTEQGIVPKALAATIARGVAHVIEDGKKPGAPRPGDYLQYEPLIIAYAGPDATRMHSGRSRQDILATTRRAMLRERVLDLADAMDAARGKLLDLAGKNLNTIVPAYTNGVQAQPTTYAHYLGAFAAAFERDAERLRQAYARLNLCPLGAAALGTSSFAVNRPRLAELLGFDGVVQNSYDAAQLSTIDIGAELVSLAGNSALTIGAFVQDIHTQYHQTSPWLLLQEGELTGTSSIMPQKRNPYGLNTLRLQASAVVGAATTYMIEAHNVPPGMPDYKREQSQKTVEDAVLMFRQLGQLLDSLVVNAPRALAEVNADYSTTTELADVLQREADVPFRIGHHFASELVNFCRGNGLKPAEIRFRDVVRIYAEAGALYGQAGAKFPLTEKRFRESLSPEGMIAASKGLGGPQLSEVQRMLAEANRQLAGDGGWTRAARKRQTDSQANLDKAFSELMASQ
ncbi:MAG TPA: argininosuccinate lyase [Usitatibacteraceae bacterium]